MAHHASPREGTSPTSATLLIGRPVPKIRHPVPEHALRLSRRSRVDIPNRYLIRKASFFSFPAFISSRIQRGVAPRPAQVSFGFFLLRYFGATLRPLSFEPFRPGGRP